MVNRLLPLSYYLPPTLLWFRLDLRLEDNPALQAALARKSAVIPVYIWSPEEEEPWPPGAASRWWLHQSLKALSEHLIQKGSELVIRRGATLSALEQLIKETGADTVYWNRRYEPAVIKRDTQVKESLKAKGIEAESFNSALLFEPWTMPRRKVFTAFWKACLAQPEPPKPQRAPKTVPAPEKWPRSVMLDLEPKLNWAVNFKSIWRPGEAGAQIALKNFKAANYETARDIPSEAGTSRLSPHLHFGEISPRRIWHSLNSADVYRRQLGWREFAHHLLFHFPETANECLRPEFRKFPWREDRKLLKAWQQGQTGYPLVDAGMRELWTTGWMHNRVRMVAASFLAKHLRMPWQEGAYWFWDTLVDADLANNTLGWQWTAGCGADAAPYFRIFNPARQAERFDPANKYINHWIPELNHGTYPQPVVNHDEARREALAAFKQIKGGGLPARAML